MPSSMISSTLLALASVATVSAHGFLQGVEIGGVYQTGWLVDYAYNPNPPASFGWTEAALDHGYVSPSLMGGPDIICHLNATNGQLSTKVTAGETMEVFWSGWPDSHKGPVIDYLASCKGNCSTVDKTTLEFFKIDEKGLNNGSWASDELIANNASWAVTIPSTIAPGNYVLRHEIIALHGGGSVNGAQLYPFCINLEVTSTGTDVPAGTLGTALYTETDPGILVNIYVDDLDYVIPGPALYTGGSGSAVPVASSAASVISTAAPVATSVASSSDVPATSAATSAAVPITSAAAAASVSASVPTTFATLVRSTSSAQVSPAATTAPIAEEADEEC